MRVPSIRSLTVFALTCSVMAGVVVLVLGVKGTLELVDAIELSLSVAVLGVVAVILVGQRRVDGKVQRLIRSHRKHAELDFESVLDSKFDEVDSQVNNVLAALGEDRVMALTHEDVLSTHLAKVEKDVGALSATLTGDRVAARAAVEQLTGEILALSPRLDELMGSVKALGAAGAADYKQLEAYVDMRSLIRPRAPLPALRGWAASPDVVRFLVATMLRQRPKLTVECGSGASSIWLGYAAEQIGSGKVVALENDERYAEMSRDLIRAHGLDEVVEIRLARLTDWQSGDVTQPWYDTEAIEDLVDIGLVFVDGPPGMTAPHARYPALPLLLPRCTDDVVIVLDDSDRGEEAALSDRWLAEHPTLERATLRFDKGAHVFRRQTP